MQVYPFIPSHARFRAASALQATAPQRVGKQVDEATKNLRMIKRLTRLQQQTFPDATGFQTTEIDKGPTGSVILTYVPRPDKQSLVLYHEAYRDIPGVPVVSHGLKFNAPGHLIENHGACLKGSPFAIGPAVVREFVKNLSQTHVAKRLTPEEARKIIDQFDSLQGTWQSPSFAAGSNPYGVTSKYASSQF